MSENQICRTITLSYPCKHFDEDALFAAAEEFNFELIIRRARFSDSAVDISIAMQESEHHILKGSLIGVLKSLRFDSEPRSS